MHVTSLRISGVRGFYGNRSVNLDFSRPDGSLAGWTVLAGRNGSGKSTILQALGLVLAGPSSVGFIPNIADWISNGVADARISANLSMSKVDSFQPTLDLFSEPEVWMRFERLEQTGLDQVDDPIEPEVTGIGMTSLARSYGKSAQSGWFYAGYGPFRRLGISRSSRNQRTSFSKLALQVASLFDESVSLADAVDWLIDQRLLQFENHAGAENLINIAKELINDGLLPDKFQMSGVTSDGLIISRGNNAFPLRVMSDGYRAITALVVDIVRQMHAAYRGNLKLEYKGGTPTLSYPGVVLIDEIDAHLHVSWQKLIGAWLKEHFPGIQFIVTTHSPYVCQSADPGGLIILPGPGDDHPPAKIEQDLYERVIYGTGDDAILSVLFGVDTAYSERGERLRDRLGELEVKILEESASDDEKNEYKALRERLTSSLSARADEVVTRLEREN